MPGLCCVAVLLNYSASRVYSLKKVFTVWIFIGNKILNGYRDPSIKLLYFPVKAIFKDILLFKKKKRTNLITLKAVTSVICS